MRDRISDYRTDTGATPMSPSADGGLPGSRTVEYHRPSRNSAHYTPGTDMALNMISSNPSSAANSPRVGQGSSSGHSNHGHGAAPSSFRSPPINAGYEQSMHPSRAAPAPPGGSRRDSSGLPPHSSTLGTFSKSANHSNHPSPNPHRNSAGAVPPSVGMAAGNSYGASAPPPRPTRAGTIPFNEPSNAANGATNFNAFRDVPPTPGTDRLGPGGGSGFVSHTPPPLHHQPFSAPGNPHAGAMLEKSFEEKLGIAAGPPFDGKEKDLPKEPSGGRSRSGTGKSSNNKKSVFGVLSGELRSSSESEE